ncbi:AlpA family phage regulatory protein [Methylopila sp. M107]|uniref:helix-turn-helix transcriptional regulator n=1 Tax=Methylopila sp. M107 TaxID=1101190 RepID=UPI0009DBD8DE|nr:AlpA family phage regulatory protein [Methylopila sp. M107]
MDKQRPSEDTYLRLPDILAPNGPLPLSKSSWWAGVKSGRYPKPVKLGPRITAWSRSSIDELLADLERRK